MLLPPFKKNSRIPPSGLNISPLEDSRAKIFCRNLAPVFLYPHGKNRSNSSNHLGERAVLVSGFEIKKLKNWP